MNALIFGNKAVNGVYLQGIEDFVISNIVSVCAADVPGARRQLFKRSVLLKSIERLLAPLKIFILIDIVF